MKQVNVLMEEQLLAHIAKLSQMVSLFSKKRVTTSDIIRKAVVDYSRYGDVVIESELSDDNKIKIGVSSLKCSPSLDDGLLKKICNDWT